MVLLCLILCYLAGLVFSAPQTFEETEIRKNFLNFMTTYNKQYLNDEEKEYRFRIFKQNCEDINEKNKLIVSGEAAFGINKFTDLTPEEFNMQYMGFKADDMNNEYSKLNITSRVVPALSENFDFEEPELGEDFDFDWRNTYKVTKVKDQGKCGSCWAFSTAGNVEGQYAMKYDKLIEFSAKQLMDCDKNNHGCGGGTLSSAFTYLKEAGGIMNEADYPYEPVNGTQCKFDETKVEARIKTATQLYMPDEQTLRFIIHGTGPMSVCVHAASFQHYKSGILPSCEEGPLKHCVLLVGYGREKGVPFWTIKNSWSSDWGERGYIRVKRNENSCGIVTDGGLIFTAVVE